MNCRLSKYLRGKHLIWTCLVGAVFFYCVLLLVESEYQVSRYLSVEEPVASVATVPGSLNYTAYSWLNSSISYVYDYRQLLQPNGSYDNLEYLVVVTSAVKNKLRRDTVRQTWAKQLNGVNARVVFILGRVPDSRLQVTLEEEHVRFGDIVQFDFKDTFRNATIKTVLMLRWASQYRPAYLVKADDDTIVNVARMRHDLEALRDKISTSFVAGSALAHVAPRRMRNDKWSVSEQEYPEKMYPDFVIGCLYFISGQALTPLYEIALTTRPLSLEDVFVTGMLATKARVPLVNLTGIEPLGLKNPCDMHNIIAAHHISVSQMRLLWETLTSTVRRCTSNVCSCVART